jgi:hypothetical protein
LAVMLGAFVLFTVRADATMMCTSSRTSRIAWWAARLSALHLTLLLLPAIAVGLVMPPFGMLILPMFLLVGNVEWGTSGLFEIGHQILSLGFPKDLRPILHGLDAAVFCAALYYLASHHGGDGAPQAVQSATFSRSPLGSGSVGPRADFGRRER